MNFRLSRLSMGGFVLAVLALMAGHCWAHWYSLGPSKDEWGVKYEGAVEAGRGDKVTVHFTISNPGRLKPIHSVFLMAFSNPDRTGTNLVKTAIPMASVEGGRLVGQAEMPRQFVDRAVVRIFTMTVDGRSYAAGPSAGARYYDVPVRKLSRKGF